MIRHLKELILDEEDSITYKGKKLSIFPSSTTESIHFKWGDKRFTVHPNWDNPYVFREISKEIEKIVRECIP